MDGGGRRRGKGACSKRQNTHSLVARHCISGNEQVKLKLIKLKTGSSLFRQKQTHVEPISETVRQFFSSQKRNGLDKSSSAITNMNRCLLHSIFSKRKSLSIAAVNLFNNFLFSFI